MEEKKYCSFEDIKDPEVVQKLGQLKERLLNRVFRESRPGPFCYTQKELEDVLKLLGSCYSATEKGLPNELWQIALNLADPDYATQASSQSLFRYACDEGKEWAKERAKALYEMWINFIDKLPEDYQKCRWVIKADPPEKPWKSKRPPWEVKERW